MEGVQGIVGMDVLRYRPACTADPKGRVIWQLNSETS